MAKSKKAKSGSASRKKKNTRLWQGLLGLVVIAAVTSAYLLVSQNSSSEGQTEPVRSSEMASVSGSPLLQNRLVLPAQPKSVRPVTLSPNGFSDPEVQRAYQVAKEIPEVLEHMACYCGCYYGTSGSHGASGHRNNLDCYKDSHGEACTLCREITLEAQHQHQLGTPMTQIKRIIDEKYAPLAR